ncbi:MAG TPA: copper-binding protein [Blastocatellia bacterium]|nr:copper-binding protein [Blastocatellia bacterium]
MSIRLTSILLSSLLALGLLSGCQSSSLSSSSITEERAPVLTDRDRDGLSGRVKGVLTDDVVLNEENGRQFESQQASSASIYDQTGKRTLQTPFRISFPGGYAITQHELFFDPPGGARGAGNARTADGLYAEHDSKGNVIEKGRYDEKGKRPEATIKYEFDSTGNWIKRVISRRTEKNGQSVLLSVEASYRHFVYYDSGASPAAPGPAPAETQPVKSPLAANEENLSAGRSLFNQRCAACHGENGKAQTEFASIMTVKPRDLTSQQVRELTEPRLYRIVSQGIPPSGMPGLKDRIRDEALWQLALYVKQLSSGRVPPDPSTVAATAPSPAAQPKSSIAAAAEQRYPFKGKVVFIQRETQQVTVEHEAIPGYMGAMTMPFPLKNEKVLGALKKDDRIEATLVVGGDGWRLENVAVKP